MHDPTPGGYSSSKPAAKAHRKKSKKNPMSQHFITAKQPATKSQADFYMNVLSKTK